MDLKEALETCSEMWHWLAENPAKNKFAAMGALGFSELDNDCALCEYSILKSIEFNREFNTYRHMCDFCPMWPTPKWGGEYACERHPLSQYRKWKSADRIGEYNEKVIAARSIANHVDSLLEDFNAEPERRKV